MSPPLPTPLAVVSGASGFIGGHLVRALLAGGWRVRVLVRAGGKPFARPGHGGGLEERGVDYSSGWVDPGVLEGAGVLFHLAGVTRGLSAGDFWRGNVEPTRLLLVAAGATGVGRFVHFSSQAAAGPASSAHDPVTEATDPHPIEDYGRSKLAAEEAVRASGVPCTILRPSSVFGAGDRDFALIFRQMRFGVALFATDPDGLVSVVHVSDVVGAALRAATDPRAGGESYFVTADPPQSWREVYETAARVAGQRPFGVRVPRAATSIAARVGDLAGAVTGRPSLINSRKMELARPRYWICSGEKIARELGFVAAVSLEQGFRDYVAAGTALRGPLHAPPTSGSGPS
jgi:nucleoside-diphosphate-sugar epimerase